MTDDDDIDFLFMNPGEALCECRPDLNNDCAVNTQDFAEYLNLWAGGDPLADWNGDTAVNTQDFAAFLNDWAIGC